MNVLKKLTVLGIASALMSCGGGAPDTLTAASGSVSLDAFKTLANDSKFTAMLNGFKLDSDEPISLPSDVPSLVAGPDPFENCTKVSGDSTDSDGDGIPVNVKVVTNCPKVTTEYGFYYLSGSHQSQDLDDNAGAQSQGLAGGYRYDYDFEGGVDMDNEKFGYLYKGYFIAKNTGSKIMYESKFLSGTSGYNKKPFMEWNWDFQTQWSHVYIPDDMSNRYQSGSAKLDGFVRYAGSVPIDVNAGKSEEVVTVMKLKSKNLTYDVSCSAYWKTGSIIFEDGSGNKVEYSYNCTSVTSTYNGEAIP